MLPSERICSFAAELRYPIVFGSINGYAAYLCVLSHISAATAGTYAYVYPVAAMFPGWAFGREPLTAGTLLAAVVILSSAFPSD